MTMAPDGGRLLKDMARLFLDLKTQVLQSQLHKLMNRRIFQRWANLLVIKTPF